MFLKRKQKAKVKAKGCAEGNCHWIFKHKLESSSHIIPSCFHVGSYMMNVMDYNYKLMSVIQHEDDLIANK